MDNLELVAEGGADKEGDCDFCVHVPFESVCLQCSYVIYVVGSAIDGVRVCFVRHFICPARWIEAFIVSRFAPAAIGSGIPEVRPGVSVSEH